MIIKHCDINEIDKIMEIYDNARNFMRENGNKNQWYYYAQNINKHIAAIDEVLMKSVHKGIVLSS